MALEFVPPKYAQLVEALQHRIEDGTYEPGSLMPSEQDLIQEFGVSRPTVVRALAVLREQGWVESRQGKGRYVRGRPVLSQLDQTRPSRTRLGEAETTTSGEIVHAGIETAPARIATLLDAPSSSKKILRRRLIQRNEEPSELVSIWLSQELAEGTDLASTQELSQGLREHMEIRKGVRFDHVIEYVMARMPTTAESRQLGMQPRTPLVVVYAAVRDAGGYPLVVLEIALPADRHELEDAYPLT